MPVLPIPARTLESLERVLLAALCVPAILITVAATVPALIVLPFLNNGGQRTLDLLRAHAAANAGLLITPRRCLPARAD